MCGVAYLLFLCISVLYMVIGDNYQAVVWFVEVLVSRSRLRAGLSGFYCLGVGRSREGV
jgi:hypothetical protein